MLDYGLLFLLMLAALTLLTIAVLGIIFALIQGKTEEKTKVIERSIVETAQKCPHFFGYLAEYPENQPIPEECFGCSLAMACKQAMSIEVTIKRRKK